jgi:hypothetical protein
MSKLSRHYRVLQLAGPVSPVNLEQAVAASRRRYMRLTARGPLRFYRHDLLADTERAYRALCQPSARDYHPKKTWLARQASNRNLDLSKPPVNSLVKTRNFLKGYEITLNARTVTRIPDQISPQGLNEHLPDKIITPIPGNARLANNEPRPSASGLRATAEKTSGKKTRFMPPQSAAEKNRIEDDFCREVLYRLEGPLLRYRSRRELLYLAAQTSILPFRANMLMSQITESIRQHQLDKPAKKEKQKTSWLLLTTAALLLIALINILILDKLRYPG